MNRIAAGSLCGILLLSELAFGQSAAAPLPDWTKKIRADHPRLFFNRDIWPAVRRRALGAEKDWFEGIKNKVDKLQRETDAAAAGAEKGTLLILANGEMENQ